MGKLKQKKGKSGNVAQYMTRNQAIKRLQVRLSDFRRLCILKGIHPREPKKKFKGQNKTYYHTKDILFLQHEPLLQRMREIRAYDRKIRRAEGRQDRDLARKLLTRRPGYKLDHLVRERYPTFIDALRDLDDALTMVHLFATLPAEQNAGIPVKLVEKARRLALEFQAYIARAHALRKAFVAVKGVYFQAEVMGQQLTWIVPHQLSQVIPPDVDFKIMVTFLEFYETLLQFVNFRLYHDLGLQYPPALDPKMDQAASGLEALMRDIAARGESQKASDAKALAEADGDAEAEEDGEADEGRVVEMEARLAALQKKLAGDEAADEAADEDEDEDIEVDSGAEESDGDEEEDEEEEEGAADAERRASAAANVAGGSAGVDADDESAVCGSLFKGLRFFLGREVPREMLSFVIRAFGGEVGFDGEGSPFAEADERVTHQVVDRPTQGHRFLSRTYVQPQWVLDSTNFRVLVPAEMYAPGKVPPPHLSPFVNDEAEGYTPDYATVIAQLQEAAKAARVRGITGEETGFVGEEGGVLSTVQRSEEEELRAKELQYQKELQAELQGEGAAAAAAAAAGEDAEEEEEEEEEEAAPAARKRKAAPEPEEMDEDKMKAAMMSRKTRKLYEVVKKSQQRKADKAADLQRRKEVVTREGKRQKKD